MDGRQRYMMFNEIANLAIEKCDGTVFGGYVRDFIKHDFAAQKFYESSHKKEDYENPEISPETRDRLLIPSDLDIHFKSNQDYRLFRAELKGRFFRSNVTRIDNVYSSAGPRVHHIRINVTPELNIGQIIKALPFIKTGTAREVILPELVKRITSMPITSSDVIGIDVLITPSDNPPPFTNLDFECNGLVMNKDGIGLCSELKKRLVPVGIYRRLESVLKDIRENRAVLVNLKGSRWDKMVDKKWDIVGGNVEMVHKSEDEVCTLCLETLPAADDVYKFSCCNASYHIHCISRIISTGQTAVADTGKCPHCRQGIYLIPDEVKVFGIDIVNTF